MAVPTTPTATDKLEEVRKLNVEIAKLTSAKEIVRRAASEAQEAYADAKKRSDGMTEQLLDLEKQLVSATKETREFVANCRNMLQTATASLEEAARIAKDLAAKVVELCDEIEKRKTELAVLEDKFAKENASMSVKREDLQIYEERIRTAAESVGIKVKL